MAFENPNRWSKWWRWMRNKYRLVILNDETFEEKASLKLSRMNLFVLFSMIFVMFILLFTSLVLFTPIKNYIPGYGDINYRDDLIDLNVKLDSLEVANQQKDAWIQNIVNVLEGNIGSEYTPTIGSITNDRDTIDLDKIVPADSQLRLDMLYESQYALLFNPPDENKETFAMLNFFKPVDGFVSAGFDVKKNHPAIDIVAPEKEPVKSVLNGTVVLADWTIETGYVIAIQHSDNLISFYKHNSVLLKKTGTFVRAGEAIAIIGNSGELTNGPHLHFELWYKGKPLDPEDYIHF